MKKVNSNKLRSHKEMIVKLKSKIILGPLCTFLYVLSESYPESSFKLYFSLETLGVDIRIQYVPTEVQLLN